MMNDECELYEFSLHTIRELHTNHELRITNREYAHSCILISDKRQLETRIRKHLDINKKNGSLSVISSHRLEHNHEFKWDKMRITDNKPSYHKKIISKMVYRVGKKYRDT